MAARASFLMRSIIERNPIALLVLGFGIYGLIGLMRLLHWI